MKQKYRILTVVLVVLFCCALVPAVSAFTATSSSPADGEIVYPGTTITVHIDGLAVTNSFKYQITSDNLDMPSNSVTLSGISMPFSFSDGTSRTSLSTTGISGAASLTVKRLSDSTEVVLTGNPITSSNNIRKDTYDVTISGTKSGGVVGIDYSVSGTVGSVDSPSNDLSFSVPDVNTGTITIKILDGADTRFQRSYSLMTPDSPRPSGGDDTGGESPSEPSGPAAPAAPAAIEQLAPMQGVTETTVSLSVNSQGQTQATYNIQTDENAGFESEVSISQGTTVLSATGQPVSSITVTPLDPATVTAATATSGTYSFSGLSIECGPTGTQFSGNPATISFTLTDAQWAEALAAVNGNTAAMSIQTYDPASKSWSTITTTVDPATHTVSAQVTHFSMYALFYKSEPAGETVKTIGELAQVTPVQPRETTVAPVATPTQTQMAPVETPAKQAGFFDGIINWFNSLLSKK